VKRTLTIPATKKTNVVLNKGFSDIIRYHITTKPSKNGILGARSFADADNGIGDPKTTQE
jgi:hypothetical protein